MLTEHDVCVMYRLLSGEAAPEVIRSSISFRSAVSARDTRATVDGSLEMSRTRTEFARRSFSARAVRAWNGLSRDVRCAPNIATFKKKLAGSC